MLYFVWRGVILYLAFFASVAFAKQKSVQSLEESQVKSIAEQKKEAYTEMYKRLHNIVKMVDDGFYNETNTDQIYETMAKGLLGGIDPYSAYLNKDDFLSIKSNITGKFAGIGAEITKEKGFIKIISPIEDSPSFKAGVKAGDYIIKIDGQNVYDKTTFDALKMLRGNAGTDVLLTILRQESSRPIEIKVKRDIVNVIPVKYETLGNDIFYIKITSFTENAFSEFIKAMKNSPKDISALIIDLRYNPGGEIEQCIMIADYLLPNDKTIVSVKGRNKNYFTVDKKNFEKFDTSETKPSNIKIIEDGNEFIFKSSKNSVMPNEIPIVVLVNGGSASASEILTAALQQNNRAIIVGEKTFGKGSVQSVIPLDNGNQGAVKLTIAKYYTPNKSSIHEVGIKPDVIEIERPTTQIKDQDIKDSNIEQYKTEQSQKERPELNDEMYKRLKADNQLWTAYTVASVSIVQNKIILGEKHHEKQSKDKEKPKYKEKQSKAIVVESSRNDILKRQSLQNEQQANTNINAAGDDKKSGIANGDKSKNLDDSSTQNSTVELLEPSEIIKE